MPGPGQHFVLPQAQGLTARIAARLFPVECAAIRGPHMGSRRRYSFASDRQHRCHRSLLAGHTPRVRAAGLGTGGSIDRSLPWPSLVSGMPVALSRRLRHHCCQCSVRRSPTTKRTASAHGEPIGDARERSVFSAAFDGQRWPLTRIVGMSLAVRDRSGQLSVCARQALDADCTSALAPEVTLKAPRLRVTRSRGGKHSDIPTAAARRRWTRARPFSQASPTHSNRA